MAYRITIWKKRLWLKDYKKMPKHVQEALHEKLRDLKQEPWPDSIQVKQLPSYPLAEFRLRIGDYRVLFNKDERKKEVKILRVLHRSKLY